MCGFIENSCLIISNNFWGGLRCQGEVMVYICGMQLCSAHPFLIDQKLNFRFLRKNY